MGVQMQRLGQAIAEAGKSGGPKVLAGRVTTDPVDRVVLVLVGAVEHKVTIPGSFRGNVAAGQDVRIVATVSGWELQSVLSSLPTPTVRAALASTTATASWLSGTAVGCPSYTGKGYSESGFTAEDFQLEYFANDVAWHTRDNAEWINNLVDEVNANADAIDLLVGKLNAALDLLNQIRAALADQGHVV